MDRTFKRDSVCRLGLLIIAGLLATPAFSQNREAPDWFGDLSLYPYRRMVDEDVDLTVTLNGNLPGRLSYFSYTNFTGLTNGRSAAFDRSEQNFRYAIADKLPIDINLQGIFGHFQNDDYWQMGLSWRVNDTPGMRDLFDRMHLVYRLTWQPWRFGPNSPGGWGLEHFFRLSLPTFSNGLYISGFVDQAFNEDLPDWMPRRPIVAEVQIGARVWKNFYAIGEYRINERRGDERYNFAAGLEYKFRW